MLKIHGMSIFLSLVGILSKDKYNNREIWVECIKPVTVLTSGPNNSVLLMLYLDDINL
jgi:hypothetical protein